MFASPDGEVAALRDLNLRVPAGQFLCVRGPSGGGKTTLLMTVGAMLRPTHGSVFVADEDLYALSPTKRAGFRSRNVGFVFQTFHLLPYLTVRQNIEVGIGAIGKEKKQADQLLDRLGLRARARHKPSQLSAGEKQRTAIARALLRGPGVILADEPTGNLDAGSANEVFLILKDFQKDGGTVVVVTHGDLAQSYADRIVTLEEGRLVGDDEGGKTV